MTRFQSCCVGLDGKLYESSHGDQDCITWRIAGPHTLRIDQDGMALVNGEAIAQTTGAFCAAIRDTPAGWELYVQRGNYGIVDVFSAASWERSYPAPYVAQAAILRINPDGTPLMNTSERNGLVVDCGGGVTASLSGWIEERGYLVGLTDNGLPGGCVFLKKPDGSCWMWSPGSDIQRPIELAVSGDGAECWIAVSHGNPPQPSAVVGLMVPFAVTVPEPTPIPESIIPPQRPAWIVDTEAIVTPRGNGISTSDGTGPVYFEDAEWVTPEMEPFLESLYFGPEPSRYPGRTKVEQAFYASAMAIRNGVPVQVCDEFGAQATADWMEWFAQNGCRATWMVEAYRPATESQDVYRAKTRARLEAHRPFSVIPPYFEQQAGGSEAESIATLNILREELWRLPEAPQVIDLFGLRRPPQSLVRRRDAEAWIAATRKPPTLRATPPPPVEAGEEPPPPIIIVQPPPKLGWLGRLLLAFKLFGSKRGGSGKK